MATWGVSSRDRECGRGAVPSPYIQGRYEGPSFIDAVHLERDSKLNHAQRLRCAVRIFSLKRGEEEVDLDKLELPLMQHHPSDWYTESVDDVFFLRWRPATWVASDLLRGHAASNLLLEIIRDRQLHH